MNLRAHLAIGALAVGLAIAPAARAQDAAQAKRFTAAQKLFDEGAYTPAYAEFKALADETKSPNAELYVALCLRGLGRLPEAYEATAVALRHATERAEKDAKYEATRDTAAAELAQLERKVARIVVAVADPPAGLVATVNGAPLPRERLGLPFATAAGDAVVRVTAPGRQDVERKVALRVGETATVTLALSPIAPGPPVAAPAPSGGAARKAGFAVAGVGVAGMVTFAVTGLMANHRYATISDKCGHTHCTDPALLPEIEGGQRLDLAANVGLGVGIAGLVGGTLLIVLGGPKSAPPPVTAWVGDHGGGLALGGVFR